MLAVFLGRFIRFTALALLTIRYGPRIVNVVADMARTHAVALLVGIAVVLGLIVLVSVRKAFNKRAQASETSI
jgi:membrane protein DedA with SNARE-associated domain